MGGAFVDYLIVFWGFFLLVFMGIGGFFMFRKFLKQIPKKDGNSTMDWERYYMELTQDMWGNAEKELLEELVTPVPQLFRDVARQKIASKIGEIALKKNQAKINRDVLIEGYIIATPKRDHKFLRKKLKQHDIDVAPYEPFFNQSREDYATDWETKYRK